MRSPAEELPLPLVDADWLHARLGQRGLCVLDASWHLPASGRDARAEFAAEHIPGARFFDIDRIADTDSPLPHMLPDADTFAREVGRLGVGNDTAREVGRLGVGNDTAVVVYDTLGLFSAARAWWMFRVFGHEAVAVLDGGLPEWQRRGFATESVEPASVDTAGFEPGFVAERVADIERVRASLGDARTRVLDARPAPRFRGETAEPRPGLRSGHMPGAVNVPFERVIDPETGRMRSSEELASLLAETGDRSVVCSCGTGVTACVLALALERVGHADVAVYDGSWAEWGGRSDTPVQTGPA
jgi:thiosulfate/3-mercaptopyruvate sulfurtransferase